jgi:uncharacterized protein (TIGR02996 family)
MTEQDAILAAILADPAADLPRLVYADWIEEHQGKEDRAEFIRITCNGPWDEAATSLFNARKWDWFHGFDGFDIQPWWGCKGFGQKHAYVDRGFVAKVSAPFPALYGGECPDCGGDGTVGPINDLRDCHCYPSGRTPGILPRLVREQPIEVVRVTDKEPYPRPNGGGYWWTQDFDARSDVPTCILDVMSQTAWPNGWKGFDTREAAEKALSDALLEWAKSSSSSGTPQLLYQRS